MNSNVARRLLSTQHLADFSKILSCLPSDGLAFAFAYGSGVFQQQGHTATKDNMLDVVLVLDDSVRWHHANLQKNRSHYSALRFLGAQVITSVQDKYGARVYYNPFVRLDDRLVKYGCVDKTNFLTDLLDWDTLYLSGRLQKPVRRIFPVEEERVSSELKVALETNLSNAVHTSLLLLPECFTELELYTTLASLSYRGDVRMGLAEKPDKIPGIVLPQQHAFRELYTPTLESDREFLHWDKTQSRFEQDTSPVGKNHHLTFLPKALLMQIVNRQTIGHTQQDTEEVLRNLANDWDCAEVVSTCLARIVRQWSLRQTMKGLLTAGLARSVKYSVAKLSKRFKGPKKTTSTSEPV